MSIIRRLVLAALISATGLPALADEASFHGQWKIASVDIAPWQYPDRPLVTDDAEQYGGKIVEIASGSMTGPDLLGCGKTELKVDSFPYAGLFEGMLAADPKDPGGAYDEAKAKAAAEKLGYTAEPVESLIQGCSEIILHKMNDKTLQFGMNNRIFTLQKQ